LSRSRILPAALAGLALFLGGACRRAPAPVAVMDSSTGAIRMAWPGFHEVSLRFDLIEELPEDVGHPQVFVHLLDGKKKVVRTFDHDLPGEWWVGSTTEDRFTLHFSALGDRLEPGEYAITAGLFDTDRGKYPLRTGLEPAAKEEYVVGRLRLDAGDAPERPVELDGSWLPRQPDTDRQVIGPRVLAGGGAGALRLKTRGAPASLFLRLLLPGADSGNDRLELAPGARTVTVVVRESCSGEERSVEGPGAHELTFAAKPEHQGGCRIDLEPNFVNRPEGSRPWSVVVQSVAWNREP